MEKTKFRENRRQSGSAGFLKRNILKSLNKVLCVLLIGLGLFYIVGANDLAIKGFALSDLKARQSKIADDNKKLELKAMALSSYNVIGEKINNLKMVAVGEVDYISVNGAVAKK